MIEFTIPIVPRSVQHGKRVATKSRGRRLAKPRFFNDEDKEAYYKEVALLASPYRPREPLDGPLSMIVRFVFPRLKKHKGPGREYHSARPDTSNLVKGFEDALRGQGFFNDDAQFCHCESTKFYAASGEEAHIYCVMRKVL